MATFRERALAVASSRDVKRHCVEDGPISTYFGQNVFALETMRRYMSDAAFQSILRARKTGDKIDRSRAEEIASGMKSWAIELGATHYTHLFQPLTGSTAEKHEAFLSFQDGKAMEHFKGSALVQQEPDASSFPNGGLRNTFEARGYTAWDPNSPAFILDGTLCIPSVFVSYTGEALDMKVPNLRSIQALDAAATAVARLFEPQVTHVSVNVGLEQEYFLVDEALYNARPDLQLCGRTVIGHTSAKDQQLSDHYFGAIPSRVAVFSGSTLDRVFKGILQKEGAAQEAELRRSIDLMSSLPEIIPDNTDRNRTSPFAFTGNRFEFRAVGSSANAAQATFVLNSAVAESLREFLSQVQTLVKQGETQDQALIDVVRAFLEEAAPVMFEGNGYSAEWQQEAVLRGLTPVTNVPKAFQTFLKPSSVRLFTETRVLSVPEIKARGGKIIAVISEGDTQLRHRADYCIEVPSTAECLMPIVSIIPLQLMAYYIAVSKGRNVDQPRNLAKSVTVE